MGRVLAFLKRLRISSIVATGVLVRCLVLIHVARFPLVGDAREYHTMASQLLRGDPVAPFWPPGLPYVLAGVFAAFGESELVARLTMVAFYVMFSVTLYRLLSEVSSAVVAKMGVLVFAFYPTYIHLSVEPLTDLPTATWLLLAAYAVVRVLRHQSATAAVGAGLAASAAALTRPSSALLLVLMPSYLAARVRKARLGVIALVVGMLVVSAWVVKAHQMTGRWIVISDASWLNIFYGNNPYAPLYKTWWLGSHFSGEPEVPDEFTRMLQGIRTKPQEEQDRTYRAIVFQHVAARPDLFVIRTVNRIRNYFAFDSFSGASLIRTYRVNRKLSLMVLMLDAVFYMAIMGIALVALVTSSRGSPGREPLWILVGLIVVYALPYFFAIAHPRYHVPIMPLAFALASGWVGQRTELRSANHGLPGWPSPRRRWVMALVLLVFAYIQVEWIFVMRSRM